MLAAAGNVRFGFSQETDYICGEAEGLSSRHIQKEVRLEVSLNIVKNYSIEACMHAYHGCVRCFVGCASAAN
jgi:hypothetical protein